MNCPDQALAWNPLRGLAYCQETLALDLADLGSSASSPSCAIPSPKPVTVHRLCQCSPPPGTMRAYKVLVLSIVVSSDWPLAVVFPVLSFLGGAAKHLQNNSQATGFIGVLIALPQCREAWLVPKDGLFFCASQGPPESESLGVPEV